jgi:hypothetical protein
MPVTILVEVKQHGPWWLTVWHVLFFHECVMLWAFLGCHLLTKPDTVHRQNVLYVSFDVLKSMTSTGVTLHPLTSHLLLTKSNVYSLCVNLSWTSKSIRCLLANQIFWCHLVKSFSVHHVGCGNVSSKFVENLNKFAYILQDSIFITAYENVVLKRLTKSLSI